MRAYWAVAALLVLSALFWWQPGLDHWVTNAFYQNTSQHFWLSEHLQLEWAGRLFIQLLVVMNLGFLAVLILKVLKPRWVVRIKAKTALYLLVCLLVGPGFVVNVILKDHWGRPRPHQVQEYGGIAHYQPVWKMSTQCDVNCSFVCGDCSMAFNLFAFVPLVRRKALLTTAVVLAGLFMSFIRVSAGGHFISDALISGLIVYLVISAIYRLFCRSQRLSEKRVECFFGNLHKRLMRVFS